MCIKWIAKRYFRMFFTKNLLSIKINRQGEAELLKNVLIFREEESRGGVDIERCIVSIVLEYNC